ncbi:trace amine-associated receptor 13c-like [Latimeria chalumnae]|uniref:trace amine-associated receptor 13c-like n=1 Tax=Latimeria chalumnae TaxID=7897 RepID=UPI0003C152D3|nr:PREDICTED: trace amine-associated receptor 13c-like [Latimeria chalumnae]|eukprot:XP_006014281.1 PREDICTED: trace amine-associated receptor 13c-like [Latimeria chalumnae]
MCPFQILHIFSLKMNVSEFHGLEALQYCFDTLNGSCPKELQSTAIQVLLYILFLGAILITICGNLVVIISIAHFKQLHSPTNLLVLSLAKTDFLLGLLVMPFSMIQSVETCWYFGDTFCLLHSSFNMLLTSVSIYHLIFIAVDRYYAVCKPLLYSTKITIPVAGVFVTISWVISIIYTYGLLYSKAHILGIEDNVGSISCQGSCFAPLFNELWGTLDSLLTFFIPCSVMTGLYTKIFVVAKRHARIINCIAEKNLSSNIKSKFSRNKETKAAKTLGIVMGVFVLCWLPIFLNSIIDPHIGFSTSETVFDTLIWLGYFNSTFNPIIYAFFYPWFQKTLELILSFRILNQDSSTIILFSENH